MSVRSESRQGDLQSLTISAYISKAFRVPRTFKRDHSRREPNPGGCPRAPNLSPKTLGCMARDGTFYGLDLMSGKKVRELELDSAVSGSIAVGPDRLIVGTDRGIVYCLGRR